MDNNLTPNEIENMGETATDNVSDEFVIGSGFVIDDSSLNQHEPKPEPKKKRNKRGVISTIVWAVCILLVSASLAVGGIFFVIDYMGLGGSKKITISIEENESLDSIANELEEKGAIRFPFLFKFYAKAKGYYEMFIPGAHTFNTDSGYSGIIYEFTMVKGYTIETVTVTIPEMATVDDIAKLLEENKVCSRAEFINEVEKGDFKFGFLKDIPEMKVHYRLEGYLFPDTYEFYVWNSQEGAHFAIQKMLENYDAKFNSKYREKATKLGYTMHEITTMASIIELECSGYYNEMPKVSSVFYNRLLHWGDQPKMLGSSPTADYPYGSGNYDTNKIEGLPPGPLCAPSETAIKAALYPSKKMEKVYYYFVTDTDFKFYYTKNLDEHNSTIYSLRLQGKWGED